MANITQINGNLLNAATASFTVSASYAATAGTLLGSVTSASYAATASLLLGSVTSASFSTTAVSASAVNTVAAGTGTWYPLVKSSISTGHFTPAFNSGFSWDGNSNTLTTTASRATIAATASYVLNTVTGTNSADLVYGNMADNDQFRIRIGGTATNAGFVEIATADDGTEPIHVRQYSGVFSSLVRTATLLDGSGNSSFPGGVTATSFTGSLRGTASNATQALTASLLLGSVTSASFASTASLAPLYLSLAGGTMTGDINAAGRTFQFQDLILGFGTTQGTIKTDGTKYIGMFPTNAVESTRFLANGNVIHGTTFTDAGYRLQVSASGAVSGALQVIGSSVLSGSSIISNQLTVGSSSQGPNENTITLGARDTVNEGGQIGFNAPGGTYTSASFIDLYQNRLRILKGTNAGSTGEVATWNLQTLQMQLPAYISSASFTGTPVAGLGVDSSGNIVSSTRTSRYGTALSGSTIGTGVTAQTIVFSQLIPANTFGANDVIRTYYRFRKLSTNANATHNIIVNTSNAVAGATTLATLTANTVHNQIKRDFYIAQGNATTSVGSGLNIATDDTTKTQLLSSINWAVDQWIIYTVTLGTTDSGYGLGYTIEQVL
jgi:hypothetical protein